MSDREAWEAPATPNDFAETAAFVVAAVEPDAADARVAFVTRLLAMRKYTRAELLLIAQEAPYRPMYGNHVKMDVVDQIVRDHREARTKVNRPLTYAEMVTLCDLGDEGMEPTQFHICGYEQGRADRPMYRYAPHLPPSTHNAVGLLDEPKGRNDAPAALNFLPGRTGTDS